METYVGQSLIRLLRTLGASNVKLCEAEMLHLCG